MSIQLIILLVLLLPASAGVAVWRGRRHVAAGNPWSFASGPCSSAASGAVIAGLLMGFFFMHPAWYKQPPIDKLDHLVGKYIKPPRAAPT